MRAVVQRVSRARVVIENQVAGQIGPGLAVLVAVGRNDRSDAAAWLAEKIVHLRIFNDEDGKMNRSVCDTGGRILAVPQFTLYGDARSQRRPSFLEAAGPEEGKALYEEFVRALRAFGVGVETGIFKAHMSVELANDGPITILLDSDKLF
jgi:D-aminoacyl-tRNA deacylase